MKCPVCGSVKTLVVSTHDDSSKKYETIRRKRCLSCGHRWYAATPFAVVLDSVAWTGTGKRQTCSSNIYQEVV